MKKNMIKYKNIVISTLIILGIIVLGGINVYGDSGISINIDGSDLYMDVPPIIMGGRTMVPLRAVSEAVGCKVDWFEEDQSIVVYSPAGGDPILFMGINDPDVTRNYYNGQTGEITGEVIMIDSPPVISNGRTMVPLRFIAESIGFDVEWDNNSKIVFLFSANYEGDFSKNIQDTSDTMFPKGVIYTEEYKLQGDPGDGLSAVDAAVTLTWDVVIPAYGDYSSIEDPIFITLVGLKFIEGEECYIFEVKKPQYTSTLYGVGPSGDIYEDFLF